MKKELKKNKKSLFIIITIFIIAISLIIVGIVINNSLNGNEGNTMNAVIKNELGQTISYTYGISKSETNLYSSSAKNSDIVGKITKNEELYIESDETITGLDGENYLYVSTLKGSNSISGYILSNYVSIQTFDSIFYGRVRNNTSLYKNADIKTKLIELSIGEKVKINSYTKESIIKDSLGNKFIEVIYTDDNNIKNMGYVLFDDIEIMIPFEYFSTVAHAYISHILGTSSMIGNQYLYVNRETNFIYNVNNEEDVIMSLPKNTSCKTWITENYDSASGKEYKLANCSNMSGYVPTNDVSLFITFGKYIDTPKNNDSVVESEYIKSITINNSEDDFIINKGETKQINYSYETNLGIKNDNSNSMLTFKSNNSAIAKVDQNGMITALGSGEATISISNSDKSIVKTIDVYVENLDIEFSKTKEVISIDDTVELTYKLPDSISSDTSVKIKSSNNSIVRITNPNPRGRLIKVKGLKVGTAKITISTKDNSASGTIDVIVKKKPSYLRTYTSQVTIGVGDIYSLDTYVDSSSVCGKVKFTTSDPRIASVDDKGYTKGITSSSVKSDTAYSRIYVHGIKEGKTSIEAKTFNGKKVKVTIVVKGKAHRYAKGMAPSIVYMKVGQTKEIVGIGFSSTTTSVWSSSNKSIVTVVGDPKVSNKATIKAVKNGTATINAKFGTLTKNTTPSYGTTTVVVLK